MERALDGFQILRKLADSNTAEIFHVVRRAARGRGGEYAAKVLRDEYADDPIEVAYLENEFEICSELFHRNLVHAFEINLDAARPLLILDLIDGPSLRQCIDKGGVPLGQGLGWLAQAADGLAHFHELGFVHRDVKPQNMVVGPDQVKVIDFALAVEEDGSFGRHLLRRLKERRRPGTWSYMAPEQIQNNRVTAVTDVYSLGVTLYEVVTGRLPYVGETPQVLLEHHLYSAVPSLRTLRPDAPPGLDDLVRGMMAKDPLDRPASMQYVSAKLRAFAAQDAMAW